MRHHGGWSSPCSPGCTARAVARHGSDSQDVKASSSIAGGRPADPPSQIGWHPGELSPRVGFLVTNLCRPPERVVAFYNQRGTAEQWIKEGKNAVKWTRLSCRSMTANAVRLQLHALAYNLANFLRTLVLPETVERWSLTTLRERVVKIGAKVINHARYTVFQMAEVAVSRDLFRRILHMIDALRPAPVVRC
jgi:Transposase DDE domain group 1